MDGAGAVRRLYQIVVPMCNSATIGFVIITAVASWNEFLWPLVAANTDESRVATVAVAHLNSTAQGTPPYNLTLMASVISTLPIVVAFVALQRHFVAGLAGVGIK